VPAVPRDLTEDQHLDPILESTKEVIQESCRDRSLVQGNRVNLLPTTMAQLRKARKVKRLQEARDLTEINLQEQLRKIHSEVIERLTKEG
jgi:hypothetical protein